MARKAMGMMRRLRSDCCKERLRPAACRGSPQTRRKQGIALPLRICQRSPMRATFVLLFSLLIFSFSQSNERPHIVLVMADDHGYGDTGFTGHAFVKTPNLDAMAKEGVVFNRFYAAAPVCSPSRASVMSGRHPFRGNVPNHGHYLRPDEVTIAEALKSAGYVTGHFGKWHIGSVQPGSPTSPGGQGFDEWLSGLNFFDNDPFLSRNGTYEHLEGPGSVVSMDATIDFLTKHKDGDKPMLTVTWFPSPHGPFGEIPQNMKGAATLYDDKDKKNAGYFREITLLDQEIGKLRKSLRELGIAENTLFLYHSDNGGLVDKSAGGRMKKGSIYEGGLRVPAVMEWPARLKAGEVDTPVNSSDLYPTLLEIAGAKVENQPKLDGVSILDILEGKSTTHPPMGFWHNYTGGQGTWSDRIIAGLKEAQDAGTPNPYPNRILKNTAEFPERDKSDLRGHSAWTDWPWKLHRIQPQTGAKVTWELYQLEDDPQEETNLVEQHPERVEKMRTALEEWQKSVLGSWSGEDYVKK